MAIILIVGSILLRLLPHLPNFAPVTATALFGGAYLKKRYSLLILLIVMLISDYLLLYINFQQYPNFNFTKIHSPLAMLHSTILYVYASFLISGLLGFWLRKKRNFSKVIFVSLLASLQFYLITNFGVWASGMYSRGLDGLLQSYIMGLPFLQWTLIGDLFYTGIFFGSYELAKNFRTVIFFYRRRQSW